MPSDFLFMFLTQPLQQRKHISVLHKQLISPDMADVRSTNANRQKDRRHGGLRNVHKPGHNEFNITLQFKRSSTARYLFHHVEQGPVSPNDHDRHICIFAEPICFSLLNTGPPSPFMLWCMCSALSVQGEFLSFYTCELHLCNDNHT